MQLEERLKVLNTWGNDFNPDGEALQPIIEQAYLRNKWFTPDNIRHALNAIQQQMLAEEELRAWVQRYPQLEQAHEPQTIGIVMAGNIPLVGFHDLLSVLVAGHRAQVKLSSKDETLLPWLVNQLRGISEELGNRITFPDRLQNFDAVIATGSNNTARYFEQYFGKHPHIIRKNRNSIAVLSGEEDKETLNALGEDLFRYFGLGCRNVSQIWAPKGFKWPKLLEALEPYGFIMENDKYKNNYDYNRTLLLLNQIPHFASDFLMLTENEAVASRIGSAHIQHYDSLEQVQQKLNEQAANIQCVVTNTGLEGAVPIGRSQHPRLWDYADGVDTLKFLEQL